jgi:hypothetical protein
VAVVVQQEAAVTAAHKAAEALVVVATLHGVQRLGLVQLTLAAVVVEHLQEAVVMAQEALVVLVSSY